MTTVASALLDVKITLALSFALSVIAAVSLLMLRLSRGDVAVLSVQPQRLRAFKLEKAVLTLNVTKARRRRIGWLSLRVDTVRMPGGVDASFRAVSQTAVEVTAIPRYAGKYRGLGAKYELNDPLGIFGEFGEVEFEDFTIDVLPLALLAPAQKVVIPAVTMGEKPAGRRGAAQVLHAGTEVELLRSSSGGVARLRASNLDELADLVVEMWMSIDASRLPEVTAEADFLVTGLEELDRRVVSEAARGKPSLLILGGGPGSLPRRMTGRTVVYTGAESVMRV